MISLMKGINIVMKGKIYYEYFVSDNDIKMKKYLTHQGKNLLVKIILVVDFQKR